MADSGDLKIRVPPQTHEHDCSCSHDHGHEHHHDHNPLSAPQRWIISILIVGGLLFLLRPFIESQMIVRVTSYSASASYPNAIRMCQKLIWLDPGNIQAWTSLGYAYIDLSQFDNAITAFGKVISLNPQDRGAASFELGEAYYQKGDYSNAIIAFERIRQAGPRASILLEADILKYRHGTFGFRSLNSMETLLKNLADSYQHMGNQALATQVAQEYSQEKAKRSKVLF